MVIAMKLKEIIFVFRLLDEYISFLDGELKCCKRKKRYNIIPK